MAHCQTGFLPLWRGDPQAALKQAEVGMALATEQEFPYVVAYGTFLLGAALAALGRDAEGVMQMRQGLAAYQATGALLGLPGFHALLAAGCGRTGEIRKGLATLAEGFRAIDKTGERFQEAELPRVKGELWLQAGVQSSVSRAQHGAEECFQKALDIARQQQAKSTELRAAMSLARLWQQQGKGDAAHKLLAEIYGWFTEGFDTADLREAKGLLDQLSA
jgi:predicted ATPase